MDNEVYILAGLAGSMSGKVCLNVVEAVVKKVKKVMCCVTLPFNFEGASKREFANFYLSILQKLDVEIIEMDNQELFQNLDDKTTFTEAFEIHFKRMKECIEI